MFGAGVPFQERSNDFRQRYSIDEEQGAFSRLGRAAGQRPVASSFV
jgi:hypothetical protein